MACTSGKSEVQNQFPVGMRVLVVEHDVASLCVLEEKLRSCMYNVTCCKRARDALKLLRERKVFFDLVLSEVHMPDMDGFKLVELIGLEMDLPPVILMSADERRDLVMRGVLVGACDYLIKPISDGQLNVMWQHVIRKRLKEADAKHTSKGAVEVLKKRRDGDDDNPVATKKPRVAWSEELHEHFVNAVNLLGIDNALPKRILELMNVPGLTRDNVASHLQRYKVNLKRFSAGLLEPSPTNSEYGFGNDGNHLLLQPNNSDYTSFSPSSASSDGNMLINSESMQGSTMNSMYAAAATGTSLPPLHFAEDQRTMSLLLQEPSSYVNPDCGSAADYGNHLQQIMWGFFHNGFAVDEEANLW